MLLSTSIMAGPIYSTSCEEAKFLSIPASSGGYFMSNDCKTVYVLPPARGVTTVVGRTAGDLQRCDEISQFNRALRKVNNQINKALDAGDDKTVKNLFEQRKNILDQYKDLSNTQGAAIELNFSNGIANNLNAFKELNQNAELTFVPVSVKEAKLDWNKTAQTDPEMKIAFNQSLPISDMNQIGMGSFNARLDLSLIGACPLVDEFDHELPKNIKVKDIAGIVTPNVVYKYEVGATYKYRAEYNLSTLAKKIRDVSTKGGLFKTSSSSTLTETSESNDWFKFTMECDNESICDKAKESTALAIKQRLLKEVFDNIALTTIGTAMNPVDAPTPGNSGASTASNALKKCANVYCQAAAVVLDVGNDIFGGTSKTDSFIKTNNHTVVEEVTENKPVSFIGVMGFGQ